MARSHVDSPFDVGMILKDAGLIAADAACQVGGVDRILPLGAGRVDARVLVDITATEVASTDERYLIKTQFSNSATFASGVFGGSALDIGAAAITKDSASHTTGRFELPFTNEINGTVYSYMRLFTEVQGAVATGINYSAFVALKA